MHQTETFYITCSFTSKSIHLDLRQMCQEVIIKYLDNLVFGISNLSKCTSVYHNGISGL